MNRRAWANAAFFEGPTSSVKDGGVTLPASIGPAAGSGQVGDTVRSDILLDYPELERDDIRACLAYAHAVLANDSLEAVRVVGQ